MEKSIRRFLSALMLAALYGCSASVPYRPTPEALALTSQMSDGAAIRTLYEFMLPSGNAPGLVSRGSQYLTTKVCKDPEYKQHSDGDSREREVVDSESTRLEGAAIGYTALEWSSQRSYADKPSRRSCVHYTLNSKRSDYSFDLAGIRSIRIYAAETYGSKFPNVHQVKIESSKGDGTVYLGLHKDNVDKFVAAVVKLDPKVVLENESSNRRSESTNELMDDMADQFIDGLIDGAFDALFNKLW